MFRELVLFFDQFVVACKSRDQILHIKLLPCLPYPQDLFPNDKHALSYLAN